jgi:hypothetical protein
MKCRQIISPRMLRKVVRRRKQGLIEQGNAGAPIRVSLSSIDEAVGYDIAISRREAPEIVHRHCPLENGGRRESRVPMTPAVVRKNAHGGPQVRRNTRPSLRDGFTAYGALSPETNSSCLRH